MQDELRRWATVGSGVAELVLNRAEKLVKELVHEGAVQREAASELVRDLMERTKEDRDEVTRALRVEIQNQTAQLGIASARQVERLEEVVVRLTERVDRLEGGVSPAPSEETFKTKSGRAAGAGATRKKATRKKATRKKAVQRKAHRETSPSRKSASGRKPAPGQSQGP
ncbi:MAG: hypothetical protein M3333_05595 [Actinomycetota bacterium]|nr:hypothetical protein [Actinomycetota bacterium]